MLLERRREGEREEERAGEHLPTEQLTGVRHVIHAVTGVRWELVVGVLWGQGGL